MEISHRSDGKRVTPVRKIAEYEEKTNGIQQQQQQQQQEVVSA